MNVSVLLITMNESANLPRCLRALEWCDDIAVVDSGSNDDTVAIAVAHHARILNRPFDNFSNQRNFGVERAGFRHDWVLHLDADEVLTDAFVDRLKGLQAPPGIDGYRIPSKTIFLGRWLRRAAMYPVYQVRLGHRERLRFKEVGHGQREDLPPERVGTFEEPYLHYPLSRGLKHWLEKHVQYAAAEAVELISLRNTRPPMWRGLLSRNGTVRRRTAKALSYRLPLFSRPLIRFAYIYLIRRGFLDGISGFLFAFMLALYEAMIAVLAFERAKQLTCSPLESRANTIEAQKAYRR